MLHTVLRRRAAGLDLIIPTGKRKGRNPGLASIYGPGLLSLTHGAK
ncbi:hypothetical protein [Embleya scabrispora]|nr:hypothetical protein [Embleya scabrispora]